MWLSAIVVFVGCCLMPAAAQASGASTITLTLSPSSILADGVSQTTATVSATDSLGAAVAGDVVTINATSAPASVTPSTSQCITDASGACPVIFTSSKTVGQTDFTAFDSTVSSPTETLTQTAGPVATISLLLNPTTILANGRATTTATAAVADAENHPLPNETVQFTSSDSGQHIGPVTPNPDGSYTAQITGSTTVGPSTITAIDGSVTKQAALTQIAGPATTISLQLNPPTILADGLQTTTATATVTDAQSHPLPTETVKFRSSDPGQTIGQVNPNGDGTYTVQIRGSTTVGASTITATDGAATPGTATLYQAAGPSTTTIIASPSSLVTNQPVTLVAIVGSTTGAPSGTITFQNGGVTIAGCGGEAITPVSPLATCQTGFAAAGSPARVTAVFVPAPGSTAPGSSGSLGIVVNRDSTSVALSTPPSTMTGRRVTYTAAVRPPSARTGPIEPTGTVEFFDDGHPIAGCTGQTLVSSTSTCGVVYRRVGVHTITARYSGDGDFAGSTSAAAVTAAVREQPRIRGTLNASMQWSFHYTRSYTTVSLLVVNGTTAGDIINLTCRGRGCPFTRQANMLKKSMSCRRGRGHHGCTTCGGKRRHRRCESCGRKHGRHVCAAEHDVDLTAKLRNHRLRAGVKLTVTITRPEWIGKYYAFRIRAGHGPRIAIMCVAPGVARPGVGCTS